MSEEKTILQVPLSGKALRAFEFVFHNSVFESRAEFIRSLIGAEYNNIINAYTPYGADERDCYLTEGDIKGEENDKSSN